MLRLLHKYRKCQLGHYRSYYDSVHNKFGQMTSKEPFYPIPGKQPKKVSAEEAVKAIKSGDNVFLHGASATPSFLIDAMSKHGIESNLKNVNLYHIHTIGQLPLGKEYRSIFYDRSLFMGHNVRDAVNKGEAESIPIFLSEIPGIFVKKIIDLNVALIQVCPPDDHGFCSLGVSVDCARAAVKSADIVIAQINKYMPRTHGDGQIHISNCDYVVEHNSLLHGWNDEPKKPNEVQMKIGKTVAGLVDNGSTLQLGIGAIPNAVCASLKDHKHIGIHTEMFMDGVVDLVNKGVITNSQKTVHRGKIVGSFVIGSKKVYDFIDDNPFVNMLSCGYVNKVHVIQQNPKMCAINSAIEIDLTGQVVADSIGKRLISGVGGQIDFMRGAALSENGKPIIAIPSTISNGDSRIVATIKPGAGVTTTRAHVHYVVTEYGQVNLFGKTMRERAKLLISIAHPKHREQLEREAYERFGSIN